MVAGPGSPYRSANAGELSPEAAGRADVKQFYSAGLRFKNVEPVPLSGFRDMGGSVDLGPVRGRVSVLAQSNVVVTPGPFAALATIWQADVAGTVCAIDCSALDAETGTHSVFAEARIGGVWTALGSAIEVGTAEAAVTLAIAPGTAQAADKVRLRATPSVAASFTCGTVTVLAEGTDQDDPRYASMEHEDGDRYFFSLGRQFRDIYKDDAFVAACWLPEVTANRQPRVEFYAENATVGLAHRSMRTQRVRRSGSAVRWVRDLWPYDGLPKVDLGGVYAKTDDIWVVTQRWTGDAAGHEPSLSLTVDGETTPALPWLDAGGLRTNIQAGDLAVTAASIKAALEALPSLGPTVTVAIVKTGNKSAEFTITFGGALSGQEYQLVATITDTAEVAALASHIQIGETEYEPLISDARGWPGVFGFVQERLAYGDIKAVPSAVPLSQAGEYFKLDIEIASPSAPRLDRLRGGQTSERVLGFAEATYFLVFTDRGVYFASNRTINKTDPLNYVRVSETGIVANCQPVMMENKLYYIGASPDEELKSGHQMVSLAYSEIETNFEAVPEHIFATHLVEGVIRFKGQKAASRADASKLWMLRSDGRLVAACVIKTQEVLGFCEYVLAAQGNAREVHVDAANAVRLCVRRSGKLRHERLDRSKPFQATFQATADLAGVVSGLSIFEGKTVWVEQAGFIEGPFTVAAGAVTVGPEYAGAVQVGLWQAPVWESMPRWFITRNDEIVQRPGRVHTVRAHLIGTTSLAIGANGSAPETVPLLTVNSPVDTAPAPFSGEAVRRGILGSKTGTTIVVTQLKPGSLQVRDMVIEERL